MSGEPAAWQRSVELPVGLHLDNEGDSVTIKQVTLRKMTGKEEALLTDPKLKNNSGSLITALLASSIVEIEGVNKVDAKFLRMMTSADRNFLLQELRRLTFGDDIETQYRCPSCGGDTFQTEDLSDIEVRELVNGAANQDVAVTLDDGFQGPDNTWHFDLAFRLPRGEDEETVSGRRDKNQVRQQDALLARCLTKVGELEPKRIRAMGAHILSSLSMSDRRKIQRTLDEAAPGPNLLREIVCDQCGQTFKATLDMRHFFPLG